MSLHDIDKNSPNRESPMPNSHDEQGLARMANGTVSVNPITDATATTGHTITKNQQVIANDGVYNKALLGYQQGLGKWGLFVAKDNVDVTTNTDLSQFILNSNQNSFKIVKVMTVTTSLAYTTNATPNGNQTATSTTAHGQSSTPAFIANIKMDSSASAQNGNSSADNYPNPGQLTGWVGAHLTDYVKATVTVDATNVYFRVMMDTLGFSNATYIYTAYVYLLQETFTGA